MTGFQSSAVIFKTEWHLHTKKKNLFAVFSSIRSILSLLSRTKFATSLVFLWPCDMEAYRILSRASLARTLGYTCRVYRRYTLLVYLHAHTIIRRRWGTKWPRVAIAQSLRRHHHHHHFQLQCRDTERNRTKRRTDALAHLLVPLYFDFSCVWRLLFVTTTVLFWSLLLLLLLWGDRILAMLAAWQMVPSHTRAYHGHRRAKEAFNSTMMAWDGRWQQSKTVGLQRSGDLLHYVHRPSSHALHTGRMSNESDKIGMKR